MAKQLVSSSGDLGVLKNLPRSKVPIDMAGDKR
jgi:hypothetical protein